MRCNSSSSLLDSGGAPAPNSGEGADNVDGEVVEDDQAREGSELVCFESSGKVTLYRLRERGGGRGRWFIGMWLGATTGMGEGMATFRKAQGSSCAS